MTGAAPQGGGIAGEPLRAIVERVERVRAEIAGLNADVADLYREAKGNGFDVPAIKALILERARRDKDPARFVETAELLELYRHAVETASRVPVQVSLQAPAQVHAHEAAMKSPAGEAGIVPTPASREAPGQQRAVQAGRGESVASRAATVGQSPVVDPPVGRPGGTGRGGSTMARPAEIAPPRPDSWICARGLRWHGNFRDQAVLDARFAAGVAAFHVAAPVFDGEPEGMVESEIKYWRLGWCDAADRYEKQRRGRAA